MSLAVILAGAGMGSRMGGRGPKLLLDLEGRTLLEHAAAPFLAHPAVTEIVAVVPEALLDGARDALARVPRERVVGARAIAGGPTRQESVRLGLEALGAGAGTDLVAVHDVARPLATVSLVDRVLAAAREHGAAIPALPIRDTVKEVEDGRVARSVPRDRLYGAQTPQIFSRAILARAHAQDRTTSDATDDAALVEALGLPVHVVAGEPSNLKITEPTDLIVAAALLRSGSSGEV